MTGPDTGRLPLAQVTEHEDATMSVLVDGEMFVTGPIDRTVLGRMLSAIAEQHASAIRVELTDTDGRVFADIIHPPTRRSTFAPPLPAPTPLPQPRAAVASSIPAVRTVRPPALLDVAGEGFVPGEDIEVAAILTGSSADPTGRGRGLLDLGPLPDGVRGVILFGTVSGTTVIRYTP